MSHPTIFTSLPLHRKFTHTRFYLRSQLTCYNSQESSPIRVTTSGNASLFHGVPDWVYEEEVFASDYALWWSPDSKKVAFLAFDETLVDEYVFPIYNPTQDSSAIIPYTTDVVMKYPKPGYKNPLVSLHVFDLERYESALGVPAASATL